MRDEHTVAERRLESREFLEYIFHKSDLLFQHYENVLAMDGRNVGENYLNGLLELYLTLKVDDPPDQELTLLIGRWLPEQVELARKGAWIDGVGNCRNLPAGWNDAWMDDHLDKAEAMFCRVGDFVDTPKGVVPSRIRLIRQHARPLFFREFVFNSLHTGCRKLARIPIAAHAAEGEVGVGGGAVAALVNQHRDHFVQSGEEVRGNSDELKHDAIRQRFEDLCKYLASTRIVLGTDSNSRFDMPVGSGFEVLEFGFGDADEPMCIGKPAHLHPQSM